MTNGEARNATDTKKLLGAFFPTIPTITAQENTDQKIVGGDEATPGEIPWQVPLCKPHKRRESEELKEILH